MQASTTHHRAASASRPVRISLENVTLRVRDRFLLTGTWWKIRPGENWVIVGPNGSGKTSLMRCLVGEVPVVAGRIVRSWAPGEDCPVAYVGFDQQWRWLRREERLAEARCFSGQAGAGTTVGEVLGPYRLEASAGCMDLGNLLERSIRHLSTGEARRVLIARALSNRPQLLVLDEPFSGLDGAGRRMLGDDIRRFIHQGMQILLVTHRPEEVPEGFFHLLRVENDRVDALAWNGDPCARALLKPERSTPGQPESKRQAEPSEDPPLVEFRNVTVRYGDTVVLGSLTWTFRRGRHWAVTGPNGSGKSTILRLIYAELLQAYANDITVFGKKRGTGETIWEIKRHIGMVGTEGQLNYRKSIPAEQVVLSGFTDSIGFYRYARPSELQAARQWMRALGIEELSAARYDRLSYGQQRLVLLARALVKSPQLLLLDEPCQGLDPENRHRVLSTIESIGTQTATHLLFVTHHEKELPACIHRVMRIFHRRQDA
jgi:molybdate transport system ATP-binding protein